MVGTASGPSWEDVNELLRKLTGLYGVELAIVTTTSGTKRSQWAVECVASFLPIMRDGVYLNWWTQQEVRRTRREGGEHRYSSLASLTYWTVDDMGELLWSELQQTELPL